MIVNPWGEVLREEEELKSRAEDKLGVKHVDVPLQIPPEGMGDIGFPIFAYTSLLRKDAGEISKDFSRRMDIGEYLVRHEPAEGYVNSFLDYSRFGKLTLDSILSSETYGAFPKRKKKVILEHTSINPTGPVHVGRARNPIIGDTMARILKLRGYDVETEFFVNDTGKQMIILLWGVRNIPEESISPPQRKKEDHRLVLYYQKANEILEKDQSAGREIERMVLDFERGNAELHSQVREIAWKVLEGMIESLERINVRLDNFFWESETLKDGTVRKVIEKLKKTRLAREENGALYLDLEEYGIHGRDSKFFFTRTDGTSLYPTRDLAYHLNKFDRCDIAINVLGEDQKLEMKQLVSALGILGIDRRPEFIFYAFVSLPEGRMSTRKGIVVYLDELLDEAVERARMEVKKRRKGLSQAEIERIAEIVGLGAVRYNILRVQAEKKMVFRWEEALDFEGRSAPFIQYAHARASSILKKAEETEDWDASVLVNPYEKRLILLLSKFPSVIMDCADSLQVHPLASYAYKAASEFNQFYRDCNVLRAPHPVKESRLALVKATKVVLSNALDTMGIAAPDEM